MTCLTGNMGNPPDADEPTDPIELIGYVGADMTTGHNADRLVPDGPMACLGFMCPAKSDACDCCKIAQNREESEGEVPPDVKEKEYPLEYLADEFVRFSVKEKEDEGRFDYLYEVHPSPSMGRGKRATATRLTACS